MALRVGFYTIVVEKDWAVQEIESLSKLFELLGGGEYREDDHLSAASYMTFDDLKHAVSSLESVDPGGRFAALEKMTPPDEVPGWLVWDQVFVRHTRDDPNSRPPHFTEPLVARDLSIDFETFLAALDNLGGTLEIQDAADEIYPVIHVHTSDGHVIGNLSREVPGTLGDLMIWAPTDYQQWLAQEPVQRVLKEALNACEANLS